MFVKAKEEKNKQVIYFHKNGNIVIYSGGSRSWRNNNPGNIVKSRFASRNKAIGSAGGFAVFPTYRDGKNALKKLLQLRVYRKLSIADAIEKYAPTNENNTERYKKVIYKLTKIDLNKKIKDLSKREYNKLINAIEKHEGYIEGEIIKIRPKAIKRVIKNKKGVITHYIVSSLGIISKPEAIQLTKSYKIRAVVVTGKTGQFSRNYPDMFRINNLSNMG